MVVGRKKIDEVKRWDMKQVKFRLKEEQLEAFKDMLDGESLQDHFEAYVLSKLQIKQMEENILSQILRDHGRKAQ